jgi:CMP-N,N'-diacetyllegionaminic acid synthase
MKILTIVPARGGSKGVRRKNIKLLGGKPLIQYPYEVAKSSKHKNEVILSSDDDEIIDIGKEIGYEVPFKRPDSLATDKSTTIDVLKYTIKKLIEDGKKYDICVLLQATSPFTQVKHFDSAIELILDRSGDSVISISKTDHFHPFHMYKENKTGKLEKIYNNSQKVTSRFDLDDVFVHVGNVYAFKIDFLFNNDKVYDENSDFVKIESEFTVNIDSTLDFIFAEAILKSKEI